MALTQVSSGGIKNATVATEDIANGAVSNAKIVDGAINNAKVVSDAAIAGSKISPSFTSTLNVNTGTTNTCATFTSTDSGAVINLTDDSARSSIEQNGTDLKIISDTDAGDASSTIKFLVDNSTKMTLDSSGRLLLGTTNNTPAANDTAGIVFGDNTAGVAKAGVASFCSDGAAPLLLTRLTSDGNVLGIADDAGTKGLLRVNSNDFEIRSTNSMRFQTGGNNDRMRLDSSGRLLIGHSTGNGSPQLSVSGNTAGASGAGMLFLRRGLDRATIGSNVGADLGEIDYGDLDGNIYASIQGKTDAATGSNDFPGRLIFATTADGGSSPSERMRIASNGHVGIGETGPDARLHVSINSSGTTRTSASTVLIKNTNNSASTCASLLLQASNTDANIYRISTQKHSGGTGSEFHLDKGTNAIMQISGDHGDIKFGVGGTMISTFTPGLSNTTTGMGLEPRNGSIFLSRSNGAVLYCNTNTDGSQLATFRRNGNEQGKIIAHSSSVSYETTSDYRLKENAVEISDGITRLKQLKPYRFNFKSNSSETLDGFFAHEAQAVVPECASGTKDEVIVQAQVDSGAYKESELGSPIYQGIDQSKLVPLVVAAVQELIGKVEALEAA